MSAWQYVSSEEIRELQRELSRLGEERRQHLDVVRSIGDQMRLADARGGADPAWLGRAAHARNCHSQHAGALTRRIAEVGRRTDELRQAAVEERRAAKAAAHAAHQGEQLRLGQAFERAFRAAAKAALTPEQFGALVEEARRRSAEAAPEAPA